MYRNPRTKADILSGVTKEIVQARVIARSTLRIEYKDGSQAIRYHDTDVVTFLPNGNKILNSGGFRTRTTKDRIVEHAEVRLYQENYIWYLILIDKIIEFYDGIVLSNTNALVSKEKTSNKKKIELLKKRIKKFVNRLDTELPKPNAGDCFICIANFTTPTCLMTHLDENYLHGSLLVNAMRFCGYNDSQIRNLFWIRPIDIFKRCLRKYLIHYLVKPVIDME